MKLMLGLALLAVAAVASAQAQPAGNAAEGAAIDEATLTLARIKERMRVSLLNQPNYTCQQTIERSRRRAPRRRYELLDTVRLEVALVAGKEMYSWPGQRSFDDRDLRELVGGGTTGTGAYALHARSVFLTNSPRFRFGGREECRGVAALRYDFVVPQLLSGYKLRIGDREAVVGYHGSFWVNAESLELLRLEVIADDIPPSLGIAAASDRIDYARVRIGGSDFLLPERSELTLTDVIGNESRNLTHFSHCRQYAGESVISFDDPREEIEAPAPVEFIELPGDLTVEAVLETPVTLGKSARGDQLVATVLRDVKRKGLVVVPKGARVSGRFLGAEKLSGRVTRVLFTLEFTEVEFANKRASLVAQLEDAGPLGAGYRVAVLQHRGDSSNSDESPSSGQAKLLVQGTRLDLMRGLRLVWRTRSQTDVE